MASNVCLCVHKPKTTAAFVNYNDYNNNLYESTRAQAEYIADYLDCTDCNISTPTIENRFTGALKALAKVINYFVQRPFAALFALPFKNDLDANAHPTLAKIARYLTIPKIYQKIAQEEFLGYLIGGSQGKTRVINAQYSKEVIEKIIHADHYSQLTEILIRFAKSTTEKVDDCSDDEMEGKRLWILRSLDPLVLTTPSLGSIKPITFKDLFSAGYLRKDNIKDDTDDI